MAGFEIDDRDNGVRLKLDPATGQIAITYSQAEEPVTLQFQAAVPRGPLKEALEALGEAAAAKSRDEYMAMRLSRLSFRALRSFRAVTRSLRHAALWLISSNETTNYTYDLTPRNETHLAATVATVVRRDPREVAAWIAEPHADDALKSHIQTAIAALPPPLVAVADTTPRWARRLGWYAVVRAIKPKLVVETGVDKGLGAVLLCSALARNAAEGHPGRYIGTDINPAAGYLLSGPYAAHGKIIYGDSITTLRTLAEPVDVFINDSDHSADYEYAEYQTLAPLLHDGSVILSDNAHSCDMLFKFANESDRKFLFFQERPLDHWYPGAGIGFAFGEPA